jgi:hypothetical protein
MRFSAKEVQHTNKNGEVHVKSAFSVLCSLASSCFYRVFLAVSLLEEPKTTKAPGTPQNKPGRATRRCFFSRGGGALGAELLAPWELQNKCTSKKEKRAGASSGEGPLNLEDIRQFLG